MVYPLSAKIAGPATGHNWLPTPFHYRLPVVAQSPAWPPAWSRAESAGPVLACPHRQQLWPGAGRYCWSGAGMPSPGLNCWSCAGMPSPDHYCWSGAGMLSPDQQLWPNSRPAAMPLYGPLLAASRGPVLYINNI